MIDRKEIEVFFRWLKMLIDKRTYCASVYFKTCKHMPVTETTFTPNCCKRFIYAATKYREWSQEPVYSFLCIKLQQLLLTSVNCTASNTNMTAIAIAVR